MTVSEGASPTAVGGQAGNAHLQGSSKDSTTASASSLYSLSTISSDADEHAHGCSTQLSASSGGGTLATLSSDTSARYSTGCTSTTMAEADEPPPLAHPAVTVLELTSDTASSSALPTPNSFGFSVSRGGSFIAMYTASSIWLIRTAQLPRLWARTLHVSRKPVAIDIQDDGSLLAVLSRPSQVDLYDIQGDGSRQIVKRRTVLLAQEAHTLALSPDGLILITGTQSGIEVVSIRPNAPETCRRTLSGPVGDSLEFSDDGRTLLTTGYARKAGSSSLFVLPGLYDGPLNEEGEPIPASPEAAWTGLVLFPETTKIARQATLLRDADTGHIDELFAFNADEDTWGIYDIPSRRFTRKRMFLPDQQRWTRTEFLDDAMPAVSPKADLAAVALRMRGTTSIWIYQLPGWDYQPKSHNVEHSPIQPCFCIPIPNNRPGSNQDITALRWVKMGDDLQRLVVVGNISLRTSESDRPTVPEGSRGVVIVLDFDRSKPTRSPVPPLAPQEYDLDSLLPGEKLPEGLVDFDREVELVRTRTLAQRRAEELAAENRRNSRLLMSPVARVRTSMSRSRPVSLQADVPTSLRESSDVLTTEEAQAAFEAPYDNTQPRSQNSLARAATVAAVSPASRRHLRALPFQPLEYRRADGLREPPHESDADDWRPPPPAYTSTAEAAQSVSLSHPNIAPGLTCPPLGLSPPQLAPGNFRRPQFQSVSSTDLPLSMTQPAPLTHQRRLSLVHPSTYPAPQPVTPGRRRSSAAQQLGQQMALSPLREPAVYQVTAANSRTTPRSDPRSRRAEACTVGLRPPPALSPSRVHRLRSVPDMAAHNLLGAAGDVTTPQGAPGRPIRSRRIALPRLSTTPASFPQNSSLSARPGIDSEYVTGALRPDRRSTMREKSKKKIGCVVM